MRLRPASPAVLRSAPPRRPAALRLSLVAGGLFALVAAAWTPAVAAPAVDAAGAKSLAASLKSGLARWFPPPSEDSEGVGFEWEGDPTVKPAGDHYDVALPRLAAETAEGTRFDIGTILLSLTPRDDGQYALALTLPGAIKVQNLDEQDDYVDAATIAIGKQAFTGTWSPTLETMLTVDAAYNDVSVSAADGKGKVSIATMTLVQDLKQDGGPTLWSGPVAFALGNLSVLEGNKEMLRIGGIGAEAGYTRIDLGKIGAIQKMSEQAAATGTPPTSAELLPKLQGLFAGVTSKMRLTNLSVTNPEDGTKVTMGQFSLQSGLTDLDQTHSSANLGFEARDFAMTPSPAPAAFTPRVIEAKLSVAKLPNTALWTALTQVAKAAEAEDAAKAAAETKKKPAKAPAGPSASDVATQTALANTMAAMNESGTELRIDALTLDTPATAGTGTGALRVATQSAFGVTGGATILLKGLDAAIKAMQPAPGGKPDQDAQNMLGMLTMVQALGQAGKDDTGAELRSYKIDVTPEGQLLLNGADMSALMGMGAGAPPAEEPPKKGKK